VHFRVLTPKSVGTPRNASRAKRKDASANRIFCASVAVVMPCPPAVAANESHSPTRAKFQGQERDLERFAPFVLCARLIAASRSARMYEA
jgi:hypothetical protein